MTPFVFFGAAARAELIAPDFTHEPLVSDPERRAVFRPHFAPAVESRRGDVGVAEPFLDLGYIPPSMRECVGGGHGA
jgi:hypothetical protein